MFVHWSDCLAGCLLLVASIWVFIATLSIQTSEIAEISSALVPQIVCLLMGVLSILLIVKGYGKARISHESGPALKGDVKTFVLSAALLVLYGLSFEPVGFVVSSVVYLFAQGYLMTEEKFRPVVMGVFALTAPVAIDYVFRYWLSLVLPSGILG